MTWTRNPSIVPHVSLTSRLDRLDMSLFDPIQGGCASDSDRRSLLALHAAVAARGDFNYLEVGSYHGASLQTFVADPRCRRIVSIDRRDDASPDERPEEAKYPDNTTARMLERLAGVPEADLSKLTTIDSSTESLDPTELSADLCLIDAEHTNVAALRDARFCRRAISDRGVIVFHDRTLVDQGIQQFLGQLPRYRAYPLAHDLFVVELNVPSLLADARVRTQVPGGVWLLLDRLRAVRPALRLAPLVRGLRHGAAQIGLALGAPRRRGRGRLVPRGGHGAGSSGGLFEIHTFVTDDALYERMCGSFVDAGFSPDAFVRLTDANDDPYAAITRIAQGSTARYPILCHQDVFADQGAGAADLLGRLEQLDAEQPDWVVAGNAGVMASGRLLRRLVDGHGGSTGEPLPLPVVTLDEDFLVLNPVNRPHCSAGVSGFHLYGADICLHALATGGTAHVIDFPVTHVGQLDLTGERRRQYWDVYDHARDNFTAAWNDRCLFRYVLTPSDGLFLSRSKLLRRVFGSSAAVASVTQCRYELYDSPLRAIDRIAASRLRRTRAAP